MSLINRKTDYALRALVFIAANNQAITTTNDLIEHLKLPRPFLRKILQVLNRKKILKSHKGNRGGVSLAMPADKIFLLDLVKIFQGPFDLNECLFKKKLCPGARGCRIKKKLDDIEAYVISQLESISVASLLK